MNIDSVMRLNDVIHRLKSLRLKLRMSSSGNEIADLLGDEIGELQCVIDESAVA